MDEKSAVERIDAAYEKLTAANARIKSLEKKLADGTLTMKEGAELTDLRAQAFGTAFSGKVLDIAQDERESACTELLRKRCDDTDKVAKAAQRGALSRQGLNLTPPTAPFEEDRARKIGHSLEDDTVPDETIQRRAKSATETMIRSQYDRNMKQGAKTCAEAGLKTYIIRDSASGCCKWCDEVAGKFAYGSEPKDVYRRHDNCSCSVVYESGRGKQNVWSKQTWSREQEREYLRLRNEMAPKRLNAKQAQALREQVGGLTFGGRNDKIDDNRIRYSIDFAVPKDLLISRDFREKFNSMTDDPGLQREFYQAAKVMLKHRSGSNGEDLYFYNQRTGKWTKSTTGKLAGQPEYTEEIKAAILESEQGDIISFHNHPNDRPPSDGDFNAAKINGYDKGYTIGHNGRIFEYTPPKYLIDKEIYVNRVQSYKEKNFDEYEAQLRALNDLKDLYGFTFREVT